jgi:PAS domain S-box-containing protein
MPCPTDLPSLVHTLLETAPIGIAVLDSELRYQHINQRLADSNGHPVAAHLGRRPRDVLPDAGPALEDIMLAVLGSNQARTHFTASAEIPPGSGQLRHWEASYHPLPGPDGQACGIVAMVEDVTARHAAERLRREHEAHVRRVLDNLFTFVGVLAPDGKLQSANRAPLEAAGIRIEDVYGLKFWDCYWWSYAPQIQVQIQHAVSRAACGEMSRFDVVIRLAGDTRTSIDFMLAPLRDEQGQITHLIASAIDISARKRSEDALRQNETLLRQVLDAMPDGLVMLDEAGLIRLVNRRMESLSGYPRATMLGQHVDHLLPDALQQSGQAPLPARPRKPPAMRRRDGSLFPCEVGQTTLSVNGTLHTLITITDVTERHQARQTIENALQEKTILLGEVHHRVKNNLQVISSLLDQQARHAPPTAQAALAGSRNHVHAMALIHQLLYERSNFSHLPLTTYLPRLLQSLCGSDYHIGLHVEPPAQDVLLTLQQSIPLGLVVSEIVALATRHASGGQRGKIQLTLQHADGQACLSIHDNGCDLAADMPSGGHHDQDLPMLPMLAAQLNATFTQERQPGQGTRFTLRFPAQAAGASHGLPHTDR